jgi:Response regulator of the LytR/AlgR family
MQSIKTIILEDQPDIRESIRTMLTARPYISIVGAAGTVSEALPLLASTKPDLLLLDVELADGLGFDVLHVITDTSVIFVTAYHQYAIKALKHGAFDYLLKPIDIDELLSAIDKAAQSKKRGPCDFVVLASSDYYQLVKFHEILYCQSDNGYTTFHLVDGRTILTSQHLKRYEDILPREIFFRPHKSFLVNHQFVDRFYKEGTLTLRNGTHLPVASRRKDHVTEFLLRYEL